MNRAIAHRQGAQRGGAAALHLAGLLLTCLAGGAAASAAVMAPDWHALAWVCLIPLAWLLRPEIPVAVALSGAFLAAAVFHAIGLGWLTALAGGALAPVWFFAALLAAACCAAVFALGRALLAGRTWPAAVSLPMVWVAYESARDHVFAVFEGNGLAILGLGLPLVNYQRLVQIVDLGGVWVGAWLVASVNGAAFDLFAAALTRRGHARRLHIAGSAILGVASLVAAWLYGSWRLSQELSPAGPAVALVADDFPEVADVKRLADTVARAQRSAEAGGRPVAPDIDLYVWPELAFRGGLAAATAADSARAAPASEGEGERGPLAVARALDATVVTGAQRSEQHPDDGRWSTYNSAACVDPRAGLIGFSDKQHLIGFLETPPAWVARLSRSSAMDILGTAKVSLPSIQRGKPGRSFLMPSQRGRAWRLGVTVCYDVCFPDVHRSLMRQPTRARPDFFVCVMRESFDPTGTATRLSLIHTRLRAVEFRRSYCRVSEGGLCGIIDSRGRVLQSGSDRLGKASVVVGQVPVDERMTLYAAWGDWLPAACLALAVAGSVVNLGRGWRAGRLGSAGLLRASNPP